MLWWILVSVYISVDCWCWSCDCSLNYCHVNEAALISVMTVPLSPSLSPSVFLLQNHSDVFFSFFTDICSNEAIKSRESDSFSPSPHTDVENCFFFLFFSYLCVFLSDGQTDGGYSRRGREDEGVSLWLNPPLYCTSTPHLEKMDFFQSLWLTETQWWLWEWSLCPQSETPLRVCVCARLCVCVITVYW